MSVTRRVFYYLIIIITLGIFAAGLGQLLSLLFDITIRASYLTQVGGFAFNQQQLSMGIAMLVIGGPLWYFFWRAVQRRVAGNAEEIGAGMRKLFLNLIILVAAITAIQSASEFFKWLISGAPVAQFSSSAPATLIVAGLIWYYHWRISESEGQPSAIAKKLRRWYVYIMSGIGLIWLAAGIVMLVNAGVNSLITNNITLVSNPFWNNASQISIAWIVLGGLNWYFHWFRMAKDDLDSTLRQVYFYLLAILGGAVAGLVALTTTIYHLLFWLFNVNALQNLQFLGWTIPTILVGAAIWSYHLRLVNEESTKVTERKLSPERVHLYLMSFLSLGTLVSGLVILVGVLVYLLIGSLSTTLTIDPAWWKNQLSICLAELIVGTPLWLYYWNRVIKRVSAGGLNEWRARSRRIFLYMVVVAAIIALVAGLVNIIYQILNGILQSKFGINVLRGSGWSIQTLVVAAPLLWYHWQFIRSEQHRGSETAAKHKTITLLAGAVADDIANRIADKLGYKIRVFYQTGAPESEFMLSDDEVAQLVDEIQSSAADNIMLVVSGNKLAVIPYEKK
jgi:hypothetical protein